MLDPGSRKLLLMGTDEFNGSGYAPTLMPGRLASCPLRVPVHIFHAGDISRRHFAATCRKRQNHTLFNKRGHRLPTLKVCSFDMSHEVQRAEQNVRKILCCTNLKVSVHSTPATSSLSVVCIRYVFFSPSVNSMHDFVAATCPSACRCDTI